jgi:membrane associated rhomboid family serine protease
MVIPIRDENPTRRTAVVTIALIAINLVVYFAVQLPKDNQAGDIIGGASQGDEFMLEHAAIPCELKQNAPLTASELVTDECGSAPVLDQLGRTIPAQPIFADKNVWLAVFVSMFLHGSILHVLGNMLFLWVFGNNVEDRMGPVPYAIFYLVGGFAATAVYVAGNLTSTVPIVGASGAIAAVMGAYLVWYPRARVATLVPIVFFFGLIDMPAAAVLGLWFVMQFFTNPNEGIAWLAHVGGFAFGALAAVGLRGSFGPPPAPRPRRYGSPWRDPDNGYDGGFRGGYPGRG